MSFNEMFDKIIRRKVSEAETDFPFDENNWMKASRMIDAERGSAGLGKTGKLLLILGCLFMVVATVVTFSVINTKGANEKTDLADNNSIIKNNSQNSNDQSAIQPSIVDNNKNSTADSENNNNGLNETTSPLTGNPASENSKANNPSLIKSIANGDKVSDSRNKNANGSNVSKADINTKNTNNSEAGNKAEVIKESVVTENANGKIENALTNKASDKQNNNAAQQKVKVNEKITSTINTVLGSSKKNPGANQSKIYKAAKNKGTTEKIIIQTNPEILASTTNVENETKGSNNYLEMRSSILQIWHKDEVLVSSVYDFIRLDEEYYKRNRRKTHFMNVEAGTTYLFGWETANGRDAKGFNAFGGIN